MTRAAAAAVDLGARATDTAGARADVDYGDHDEGDDDRGSSVLKFSSWTSRMWKVK